MSVMSVLIKYSSILISAAVVSVLQQGISVYEENAASLRYVVGKQEYF